MLGDDFSDLDDHFLRIDLAKYFQKAISQGAQIDDLISQLLILY